MQVSSKVYVFISDEAQQSLFEDVCQRKDIEACGVLLGHIDSQGNWYVERVQPLQNSFQSSVYFEFEPEEFVPSMLSQ